MSQIYTILFDLDGTLVDTAPDLIEAHNHVMKKYGHKQKRLSDIKSLAGRGAWVMMQRSFKEKIKDEKTKKEMTKEFIDFYSKNLNRSSFFNKSTASLSCLLVQTAIEIFLFFAQLKKSITPFIGTLFLSIFFE